VFATFVRSIVLLASLVDSLATVVLTATKGAAYIATSRIPWMGEEANPAVATSNGAAFQIRMIAQDGIERELILTNKRTGAVILVPVLAK
jgi:hypothetical protein